MSDYRIIKGDITELELDAIVNAANESLLGGGGVDGTIHKKAGPDLLKECLSLNGCHTSEAKLTKGYRLKCKYIIHTVGPIYYGLDSDAIALRNCYINCLTLAMKHDIHSIAFPAISTGAYRYPSKEAAEIAIKTVRQFMISNPDYEFHIVFCCYDETTYQNYLQIDQNSKPI